MKKDLVSLADFTPEDTLAVLKSALAMKRGESKPLLKGQALAIVLQKPSLRTRVSFEVAMQQLGGHAIPLSDAEVGLGKREPVQDVARVLSRYVQGIVARTFSHKDVELLACHASVPVVNGLSDAEHPCQALADLLTIYERKGTLAGATIAYIGDGNNTAASLCIGAAQTGANFVIACPQGYDLPEDILQKARPFAKAAGREIICLRDPREAAKGADVVYTDVWTSMGQEAETAKRRRDFHGYQVNPELMALAKPSAIFMHDLPAHRGEEISDGMLEHPASAVFDQAENRLHAQKAVLVKLMGKSRARV